ncbi:hypothetical protein I2I11_21165 [Pontibacter sp. 172403-2]|uniref:hypothetical protein n=1 Tax=Pontibacter rufus TaxID=2791028 RepID=UPI0018AFB864|nr:hypothetical protein [Pontibacter sp. 172403-2]MBF9255823.1 hypothetical protein [Pontibacter sp. 172403-2]
MKTELKPAFPTYPFFVAIFFIGMGGFLFTSPFLDTKMTVLAIFMLSLGITCFYFIEDSYKRIKIEGEQINLTGYFSIIRQNLKISDVIGYELHQKVHQHLGLHNEVQLSTSNGKKIKFKREAYPDYNKLEEFIGANFAFLEHKPMQYGQLLGKWIPILMTISGILAGIVGLLKL